YTHGAAWFLARLLVRHVDPATLVPLCCEKGYPPRLRTAIIDELAQGGNSAFLSPFLTALEKRATLQEVRMALARALGYMARDEETVNRLLALYQGERSEEMRDALYTALYHICRRANVTIVPEGLLGSRLRVVKR